MDKQEYQSKFVIPMLCGDFDEYLDSIELAVRERRADIAPKAWHFKVGDRVRFTRVRPKYLIGAVGTISKVNSVKVVVDLDQQTGRFYRNITTPTSMIEKIPSE
jgi:hypothetical protein